MTSMRCPACLEGELRPTHVYPAGRHGQARDYVCMKCGARQTSVTFLVKDRDETGGARKQIQKMRKGKTKMEEFYVDGS